MFDINLQCSRREENLQTIQELGKHFKKLAAVNFVEAKGSLDGTFQLVFDKAGLFTISGSLVMQPENRILEEIRRGELEDAHSMEDAVRESGNLLVGSWDRIFRENLDGHVHFKQKNTFLGNPWDSPEEKIGIGKDEQFLCLLFEMTVGSYPPFKCGVIFPEKILNTFSTEKKAETVLPDNKSENRVEPSLKTDEITKIDAEKPAQLNDPVLKQQFQETIGQSSKNIDTDVPSKDNATKAVPCVEQHEEEISAQGPVSQAIKEMTHPSVSSAKAISLGMCARDIMQTKVAWLGIEDSVQDALTKMQQEETGYVLVGKDGQIEGIVSKSDISSAVSIYLRPVFAKWRRPLDDATLQIKLKWIMSRPVHTVKTHTSLEVVMQHMLQFGGKCLPVADEQNKIQGLITAFDIFTKLLNSNHDVFLVGKPLQMPSNV